MTYDNKFVELIVIHELYILYQNMNTYVYVKTSYASETGRSVCL